MRTFGRTIGLYNRGLITASELPPKFYDIFVNDRSASVHLARQVWDLLLDSVRPAFIQWLDTLVTPSTLECIRQFKLKANQTELRQLANSRTVRLIAWVQEFRKVITLAPGS